MVSPEQVGWFLLFGAGAGLCAFLLGRLVRARLAAVQSRNRQQQKDWRCALVLFSVCVLVYIGSTPGTTTTSDEDILALVRAISRGGTLEITRYTRSFHDAAFRDGRFFSHKPPGTALIALPFYNLPRLLRPILLPLTGELNIRIIRTDDGHFVVDRCPGPSSYVIECQDLPTFAEITLVVYETFARPANFLLNEVVVYDPGGASVPLAVNASSAIDGSRPANETVDGNTGEDMVHGWPGAAKTVPLPVYITWRLERPVAPRRIVLEQLSPYRDHLIRSFELTGWDVEGKVRPLRASAVHIEPSLVDWCEKGACSSVALVSALGVILLFSLLRAFEIRRDLALGLACLFAFATLQWRYAAVLYNHSLLTTSTLGALFGLLRVLRQPNERSGWWILGGSLACSVLADSIASLVVVVSLAGVIPIARQFGWKKLTAVVMPFAFALGVLSLYQWFCFGSPVAFPQQYSYHHSWLRSFSTAFDFPVLKGLWILLLHRGPLDGLVQPGTWIFADLSRPFSGLFIATPFLIFSFLGLGTFLKNQVRFAVCSLVILLATVLVMGSFRTPWGGDDYDVRYIHHVVPMLFLPLGIWANNLPGPNRVLRIMLLFALAVTMWAGLAQHLKHLTDGPGREDLAISLVPQGWAYLVPAIPCFPAWPLLLLIAPPLVIFVIVLAEPIRTRSRDG